MNLLDFTTTINEIEIIVKLHYHTLTNGQIMNQDKIYDIIYDEFDSDRTFQENADHIRKALKPYCYEVSITPPYNDSNYVYTSIVRK